MLVAVFSLAAVLRVWAPWHGQLVWHPDEIFLVVIPLGLFSGDLNPHYFHYPSLHYYLLGLSYGLVLLVDLARGATGSLHEWVTLHGLFDTERLRDVARWVSVAFSLATVAATAVVARRIAGPAGAVIAGAAMAVSVLHVRQSPLACVDLAMSFWFVLALWSALRILDSASTRSYALAGVFIGLCAGTKYPGVAAAGAVLGAHLLARRGMMDRRLWLAGISSMAVFSVVSPFVWLDFDGFRKDFLFQFDHVRQGTQDMALPVLHHLWFSLRHNLAEPAWIGTLATIAWALWRRDRQVLVVLCAALSAYALVSWGNLVFVRYALPLLPLQAVLVATGVQRASSWLADRHGATPVWIVGLSLLVLALPAWRSIQVTALLATPDTRTLARDWLEQHVSSGSRCCNFGGWAGDVQTRTDQHLWWLLVRHQASYTLQDLHGVSGDLHRPEAPYYSFPVGGDRSANERGNWPVVDAVQCDYVIAHDHWLPSSRLDGQFVARLPQRGQRVAAFTPGPAGQDAVFDPMDAYYVPIESMADVERPGPAIEIWRIDDQPTTLEAVPTVDERLARAHALLAMGAARDGRIPLALRALHYASLYNPLDARAVEAWGRLSSQTGRVQDAVTAFQRLSRLEPEHADGLEGLARVLHQQGQWQDAAAAREAAVELQPGDPAARRRWALALLQAGQIHSAAQVYQQALELDSTSATTHHALGTVSYSLNDTLAALRHFTTAVELAPDSARYHLDAGVVQQGLGHEAVALAYWQRASVLDTTLINAHRYVANAAEDLGDSVLARDHWRALQPLVLTTDQVLEAARALQRLGKGPEADVWVRGYLESVVDTVAAAELRAFGLENR